MFAHRGRDQLTWNELMNQSYPVPPPELVAQWHDEAMKGFRTNGVYEQDIATQAAQWGADQELEATLGLMVTLNIRGVDYVRNARRSARAPSLKEQALKELRQLPIDPELGVCASALDTIRRALEALDD